MATRLLIGESIEITVAMGDMVQPDGGVLSGIRMVADPVQLQRRL